MTTETNSDWEAIIVQPLMTTLASATEGDLRAFIELAVRRAEALGEPGLELFTGLQAEMAERVQGAQGYGGRCGRGMGGAAAGTPRPHAGGMTYVPAPEAGRLLAHHVLGQLLHHGQEAVLVRQRTITFRLDLAHVPLQLRPGSGARPGRAGRQRWR
jgi:hypothetical protein